MLEIHFLHFYTCVPKTTIIQGTVPEIWKERFLSFWAIFCPLPPNNPENQKLKKKNSWIYHHFTQMYHKWHSYDAWFLRYETWQTEFFVILGHFLSFYHTNNTKIQNLKKMKKSTWKYHILHKCTKNLFFLFQAVCYTFITPPPPLPPPSPSHHLKPKKSQF